MKQAFFVYAWGVVAFVSLSGGDPVRGREIVLAFLWPAIPVVQLFRRVFL